MTGWADNFEYKRYSCCCTNVTHCFDVFWSEEDGGVAFYGYGEYRGVPLKQRIKDAWRVLTGKPVCVSEVVLGRGECLRLADDLHYLVNEHE